MSKEMKQTLADYAGFLGIVAVIFAAMVLLGCDPPGELPAGPTAVAGEEGPVSSAGRLSFCVPTVSYDPLNFSGHTVAIIEGTCEKPTTTWTLLTNPDGLNYETYTSMRTLILNRPDPHGPVIRVIDFIYSNPICLEAATRDGTVRVAMLDTPQAYCDALPLAGGR